MAEKSSGSAGEWKLLCVLGIFLYPLRSVGLSANPSMGSKTLARISFFIYTCACLLNCWSYATSIPQIKRFTFTEEPHDVTAVKDMAALLHCSAHYPNQSPDIQWLKDGEFINFKGENRRYRLSNGSLYFNEVHHTKGPDSDRGRYQCVASVEGLGSIVSRVANLYIAHLARTFDVEPQPFSPELYLGDVAMLKCTIQGTPNPTIVWYRDGDKLEERFNIKGDKKTVQIYPDGVLEITGMEFEDFGTYQCEASNVDRTRRSSTVEIVQNPDIDYQGVPPRFIMKPEDTRGILGEVVHLYCGANGRDRKDTHPKIIWLKDGTTVDTKMEKRFKIIGQGTLQISNVTEEDAGTYTCRASNLEDSIDADALLHILVEPKIVKPPKDVYAHVTSDVTFDCEAHGIPQPTVKWLKDGDQIIPSDYFQITDKQGLRILGVVASDDGIYQCFVENKLSTMQASAQLVILQKGGRNLNSANLPQPPTNLQAALISTGFVTLLWRQPQSYDKAEPITMYSVFWKEKGSDRERMMNTTILEANIQHLKPNTEYEFRVLSYNKEGASTDFAKLTVRTEPEVFVPSPATNVRATTMSADSIKVEWDPPAEENGNVVQYSLIYYEVGASGEHEVTVDEFFKTLTGLKAFTEYSFRVVAHNQNGPGRSTEEFVARTYSDRPSAEPQNVTLEVSSTTTIIVRWEPPAKEHQNGFITGYKIRYKKKGGTSEIATPDKNRRAFALTGLERNTEFQVRLTALTINGSGPATDWLTARTLRDDLDESRVPGKPTRLRLQAMSNSIIVRWEPPADPGVAVKGYILGYGIGFPDSYVQELDARQLHYRIENLRPASEYVISLKAFNDKGHGFESLETAFTREEPSKSPEPATPMIPPVGLKAIVLSAKTIVLTWTDSTLGKSQRINDNRYYTIRYTSIPNKNSRYRYSNSTDLNIHIDDLKPNTQYEFSAKVIKGRRQSTWSLSVFNTTFEAAPGSIARDLTPVPVEGNPMAVTLNWQPPQRPNGQIIGYLVLYTTDSSQGDRSWVVEGVLGAELSTTINDLTPDTTYYFKVQPRNNKGYGPMSPTVIYRTPKADGTGGGRIETPGKYPPTFVSEPKEGKGDREGSNKQKGISNNVLIIIIACVVGVTFCVIIFVVTLVFCRRRTNNVNRNQRNKGTYKSPSKGPVKDVKPPDLWIHHDHLELKNMEKPPGGEPTMTVTPIPRNSQEIKHHAEEMQHALEMDKRRNSFVGAEPPSYEPRPDERYQRAITVRPKPIMLPVDQQPHPPREPIATVTAIPNGHIIQVVDPQQGGVPMRPVYPRTQYNTQYSSTPRVHAGDVSQPSSIYGDEDDEDPLASDPLLSEKSPYRTRIGYVKPQQPVNSPYKKPNPPVTSAPIKPRMPITHRGPDVTLKAKVKEDREREKSLSTEELTAEMANLEGLMKDLNAITQQEFEC